MRWSCRPLVVAALLVVLPTVAGCGVRPQSRPVGVPSASLTWAPTATAGVSTGPTNGLLVAVFLVRGKGLVRVWRASPKGQDLNGVLACLAQRPTRDERAQRLRSAIPPTATKIEATIVHGVALVQLPTGFETLTSSERVLAVAQLVYTLTAQLPVTSLHLVNGKRTLDTPVGSGRLVARAVTREDFASLAPEIS